MTVALTTPPGDAPLPPLPDLTDAQVAGLNDPDLLQQCVLEQVPGSSMRRIGSPTAHREAETAKAHRG